MISIFYQEELYEAWILKQVSSKSRQKWGSYGHLKNSIWPTFSRHFEYLISFQNILSALFLVLNTITASEFQQIYAALYIRKMFY